MPTIDSQSARLCGSRSIRLISERSSCRMSIGSRVRCASADEPLPKPSSATCTPRSRRLATSRPVRSSSDMTVGALICRTSRSGRQAGDAQRLLHVADQRAGREVVERDLEPDAQRRLIAVGQAGGGAGGLLERPAQQLADQAGALGQRQELRGRHLAELGVPPAQLRLHAGDPLLLERHDRLEEQEELVAGARALQVVPEPVAAGGGVTEGVGVARGPSRRRPRAPPGRPGRRGPSRASTPRPSARAGRARRRRSAR